MSTKTFLQVPVTKWAVCLIENINKVTEANICWYTLPAMLPIIPKNLTSKFKLHLIIKYSLFLRLQSRNIFLKGGSPSILKTFTAESSPESRGEPFSPRSPMIPWKHNIRELKQQRRRRRGRCLVKNEFILQAKFANHFRYVQYANGSKNLLKLNMWRQRTVPNGNAKN